MNVIQRLTLKCALEVLASVPAGLALKPLMDQTERMIARPLTDAERAEALRILSERKWVYSYRDPILDEILYTATEPGKIAMLAL